MTEQSELLATFRKVHELHVQLAEPLDAQQLRTDSFDPDWLVASLLSHMGSLSEIMTQSIKASLEGRPSLDRDAFEGIWDRWNAMSPEDQRDGSIAHSREYVSLLEGLTDEQRDGLNIAFLGGIGGAELISSLMNEYAMHVWDLDVTFNDAALVLPGAVPVILGQTPKVAARYKFGGAPFIMQVETTEPTASFVATFDDAVELSEASVDTANVLRIPAEAFVRLVFGRLDPAHTPADIATEGDFSLDDLRAIFVGL